MVASPWTRLGFRRPGDDACIDADLLGKEPTELSFDHLIDLSFGHPAHFDGADVGQEDSPVGVDLLDSGE